MSTQETPLEALPAAGENLITLQTHVLSEERRHPGSTGTLSWILSAMALSTKIIASKVRRARLEDVFGSLAGENVQGEVLYGSSTLLVLTTGRGVQMFVLDPAVGTYLLVEDQLTIPQAGKIYSLNEGNRLSLPDAYQQYLHWSQQNGYSGRYVGSR